MLCQRARPASAPRSPPESTSRACALFLREQKVFHIAHDMLRLAAHHHIVAPPPVSASASVDFGARLSRCWFSVAISILARPGGAAVRRLPPVASRSAWSCGAVGRRCR